VIKNIGKIIKADNTAITGLASNRLEIFLCNDATINIHTQFTIISK
jgi:hypothetical protein